MASSMEVGSGLLLLLLLWGLCTFVRFLEKQSFLLFSQQLVLVLLFPVAPLGASAVS